MKKMKRLLLLFTVMTLIFMSSGCVERRANYIFNLKNVQRPKDVISKYGIGYFEGLIFEDDLYKIVFTPEERGISFEILNKSDRAIKIIWDEVAYVDQYDSSHRVLHLGTRFIHSDTLQPVSSVPMNAKLDDLIVPADYAEWRTSTSWLISSGWQIKSLFPETWGIYAPIDRLKNLVSSLNGKSISIFLPLKIGDYTNEYLFVFRVKAWIE